MQHYSVHLLGQQEMEEDPGLFSLTWYTCCSNLMGKHYSGARTYIVFTEAQYCHVVLTSVYFYSVYYVHKYMTSAYFQQGKVVEKHVKIIFY